MRRFRLVSTTLAASAALLIACDGRQPFEPSVGPEGSSSAKGSSTQLAAPSNATATALSETRIDVGWRDNSTNESGFEVHRSTAGVSGTFTLLATTGGKAAVWSDVGLNLLTQYCYKVRAVRVIGGKSSVSGFSNTACTSTSTAPGVLSPPSNTTAMAVSDAQIDLTWQDNSSSESGFWILRSTDGAAGNFVGVTLTAADAEAHSDRTVRAGMSYCYKVHAVIGSEIEGGYAFSSVSAASNISCATVPLSSVAPAAAADMMAKPQGSHTVEVSWRANSSNATGFRLYRSTDNGQLWTLIHTANGVYTTDALLAFTDGERDSEQQGCYRAVAFNSAGDAPPSEMDCTTPPAAATSLVAIRVDEQSVDVAWADNSNIEDKYEVWAAWSSPYRCYGACNADVLSDFFRVAELPANSVSWRCANCGEMWFNEQQGEWGYITHMFVVAVKDGGKSDYSIVEFPQ